MSNTIQIKLVLLGNTGVGKSSLVLRFATDNFKIDEEPTIGASYMGKLIQIEDKSIKFNIWDTAGQERYHSLAKMYYKNTDAAVLVYDITKRDSFEGLKNWVSELESNGPNNLILAIVGNKEDLLDNEEVPTSEARSYAESIGAVFRKTSAKTNYGVEQLFQQIALRINPDISTTNKRNKSGGINLTESKLGKKNKKCC